MLENGKTQAREKAESLFFWWRIVITIGGLIGVMWVQFVGDGIRTSLQDFLGVDAVMKRLDYIEGVMPPPRVVDWVEMAALQVGECTPKKCEYQIAGARTAFGETCGRPEEIAVLIRRANGTIIQTRYNSSWTPIELSRSPQDFVVSIVIPPSLAPGAYYWQSRAIYPSCKGPTEPIPRYSPWWPLTVTAAD